MEKNNKCCIGILKEHLFWDIKNVQMRHFLWDGGSKIQIENFLDIHLDEMKISISSVA